MTLKEFGIASLFFLILTCIFFYKVFFGLIPLPTDLLPGAYFPWHDYDWGYVAGVPVKNTKLSDAISLFYPLKTLAIDDIKKGEFPLWNPHMFAGYPLYASVQVGILFPTIIFYLFLPDTLGWTLQTMSTTFFASLFMYLFLRRLKLDTLPAVFGSIAYGFGGYTLLWLQWNTQATTSMMLPILLLFEDLYLETHKIKWGIFLSICFCFQIFAGYLPVIPPTLLCLGIWYLFKSQNYLKDLKLAFFFILGVSLSAVFTLPVAELTVSSQRTLETLGSQNPFTASQNFLTLIAPDFFGSDATGNFWGIGDHIDATLYTGIVSLLLSIIGIKEYLHKKEVLFALIILAITIFVSIQNPISEFLYKAGVWGGATITMNRLNFLINFGLALLASFGIQALKKPNFKFNLSPVLWIMSSAVGIISGLLITKYLLNKWLFLMTDSVLYDSNVALVNTGVALKNLILPSAIIAGLLLVFIIIKWIKQTRKFAPFIFILVLIFELFRFGLKFNDFAPLRFLYPKTALTDYLQKFPNDRFVAEPNVVPANMWVPYGLSTIEGYDGIYPLRMAKLLAVANSDDVKAAPQPRWGILNNFNSRLLANTNTRFMLALKLEKGLPSSSGTVNYLLQTPNYKEVLSDHSVAVLENKDSLPRAFVVNQVVKSSDEQALTNLVHNNFPIRWVAFSDDLDFKSSTPAPINSTLNYKQITNSHISIDTNSDQNGYLVVLDSFYPGWKAFVDGVETKIHRTNYDFRGIMLPQGNHKVEFIYRPNSLLIGAIVSTISIIIILLCLFTPLFNIKKIKRVTHSLTI